MEPIALTICISICVLLIIISKIGISWREIWFMLKPTNDPELSQLKHDILKIWTIRARNSWSKFKRDIYWGLFDLWITIKGLPGKIKRRIWNKHILLAWNRLWIRKNEFHPSLDMDIEAILEMSKEEREKYSIDLVRRRQIAHDREIAEQDAKCLG